LALLELLFKKLHEVNMKIHPRKCEFVVTLIVYLGHEILPNGIIDTLPSHEVKPT
jgi:hypothetical protein